MKWMIVAGGTGGHIMPGLALAEELLSRGREVTFVCGSRPIEREILKNKPFLVFHLSVEGFVGRSFWQKLVALIKLILATIKSLLLIKRVSTRLIFAEGGYVSLPVVIAGKILGRKIGLHEQNVQPGLANLLLAKLVDRIFLTFSESEKYFPKEKVRRIGSFVRNSLFENYEREHDGVGLLILGGSLGARFINDLALATLPFLLLEVPNLYVIWQTGLDDYERVKERFKGADLVERVKMLPFIENMGWAYRQAEFVLCRAGASTIAELCALGIPALFIPFPYATHQHQEKNARVLAEANCAFLLLQSEASPERVLGILKTILGDRERLSAMSKGMKRFYQPGGISRVIAEMESLV